MGTVGALGQVRAAINEPRLLQLLDYWLSKCAGGRLPARADVDPLEMRFILGNLILVDVLRDPLRFRYRLVGVNIGVNLGFKSTGGMLDQHPDPTFRRVAMEHYSQVATFGLPLAVRHNTTMDGRIRRYQVLLLPLARDGRTVDMVMAGQCFDLEVLNLGGR